MKAPAFRLGSKRRFTSLGMSVALASVFVCPGMVQQQALRHFARTMADFFAGTHGKARWRKAGRDEGFRVVAVKPGVARPVNREPHLLLQSA